jgi:hypothetical protein
MDVVLNQNSEGCWMNNKKSNSFKGIAALFDEMQIKTYFVNFLYFVIGVEIIIFFISFFGSLGPDKGSFPWKFYFFVAFAIPIAITFLLGVFIFAFNNYLFGREAGSENGEHLSTAELEKNSYLLKMNIYLHHMRQVPFLILMFALLIGSLVAYNLDAIILFVLNAGEVVVKYGLIALCIVLVAGIILSFTWIVANYKLKRRHMEHHYRYKNDVMQQLGLLITDDERVITKDGDVISSQEDMIEMGKKDDSKFQILPPPQ